MKPRNHVARSQLLQKGGAHQPALVKQRQQAQRALDAEIDAWRDVDADSGAIQADEALDSRPKP